VTILAPKSGTYEFHCDLFCGDGHEGMTGKIIVED
jgi:heme/copper-type cytochrome/quinol oxidase subunit 2